MFKLICLKKQQQLKQPLHLVYLQTGFSLCAKNPLSNKNALLIHRVIPRDFLEDGRGCGSVQLLVCCNQSHCQR